MSIADQVQTIARREYELLRTAAKAVDRRLEPVVGNSPGLGSALDRVREVLRDFDDRVTGAGSVTDEQAAPPRTAPEPEPKAEVPAHPEAVDEVEVEHLADDFLEEESDHHAGELADNEDLRDVQAQLRAKHAIQEQHEQQP